MRVIITGGTGLIGSKLAESLAGDGHEVIVLSRSPERHTFPAGVRGVKWDARSADGWGHLADGAAAIVNLAGENLAGGGFIPARWTAQRKRRIIESRVSAGKAVVAAIQAAETKPKVLIQSSAIGYYGSRGDEPLGVESGPGSDWQAQVCVEWEASTAVVEEMGVRRVVLRTGVVLDLGDGALPRLVLPIKLFVGGPFGSGRQYLSWIHLDDQVRAIRFLIEQQAASGPFNLTAPNPLTNRAFGRTIAQVLGRPYVIPVPRFAMQLALGEVATLVLDGQRVLPYRLQEMGFTFRYPEARGALEDLL